MNPDLEIPIVKTKDKAIHPYMVETMPTENWSSNSIWKELEHAKTVARCIKAEHPRLPVQIRHYTGGPYPES